MLSMVSKVYHNNYSLALTIKWQRGRWGRARLSLHAACWTERGVMEGVEQRKWRGDRVPSACLYPMPLTKNSYNYWHFLGELCPGHSVD